MVKHRALPIKAMITSNAGKRIEMTRKHSTVMIRMATFMPVRKYAERPPSPGLSDAVCWWSPNTTSAVLMIGLAFRGILVKGMIAMKAHMKNVRIRG